MEPPRSDTALPPVRRRKRRNWGRGLARILCVLFTVTGFLPIGVGLVLRTSWARNLAEAETRKILTRYGIDARFDLDLHLWPLSVGLRNLRVEASDGGGPFLTARHATAKPKIFGLLSGKVAIDEVEISEPSARVVIVKGQLANLALHLPESDPNAVKATKPPFSVISTSDASVDLLLDGMRFVGKQIDADVTTDEADGAAAYEVAVRAGSIRSRMVRELKAPVDGQLGDWAVDEDLLCRIDGRARIDSKRILIRRLSATGVADLDPAEETGGTCDLPKSDKRYVELGLGHLTIAFPTVTKDFPAIDGHIHLRAPLKLIDRAKPAPGFDGFASLDLDLRLPAGAINTDKGAQLERIDITDAHLDVTNLKIYKFEFSKKVTAPLEVHRGIVTSPGIHVEIANGTADIRTLRVDLKDPRVGIKADLDIENITFTKLLQDLKIHPHPHVTWDVNSLRVPNFEGTIFPLNIEGDMTGKTANFAVYDAPMDSTGPKQRATGVTEASLQGRLAIHPKALEFMNTTVIAPRSVVRGLLVSIGYNEILNVVIPNAQIDLRDLSPLGSVPITGLADLKATVTGAASDPKIAGEVLSIKDFSIGEKPSDISFGTIQGAKIHLEGLSVILEDVKGQKNKSTFEMPTGRLDFGGEANMRLDGAILTKNLDVRDFFSVFHMDEDPRFEAIHAQLESNARVHLALGGPEDQCGGGFLDVQGVVDAHHVEAFGERFDEAQADFEYRWSDRQAGIEGADIDLRSISLSKVKKENRPAIGTVLGSVSIARGGDMRGSLVMQGYPLSRADLLGDVSSFIEGSVSGVARIGGNVSSFFVDADVEITPIRLLNTPFGASDLQVHLTQTSGPVKVVGQTRCKGRMTAPFEKDAYFRDLTKVVSGEIDVSGRLFDRQVVLDGVKVSRQDKPVTSGKISFEKFDLAPIGRLLFAADEPDDVAVAGMGGEVTGLLDLDRIDAADPSHAKASFTPKTIKVVRGNQRIEWRPPPTTTPTVIALADDQVKVPPMVFELVAANGFKGAASVSGSVKKLTRGMDLALAAELAPIDLGILVGIVPKLSRASGTLTGKVKLAGTAKAPTFDGQVRVRSGDFSIKGAPGTLSDVDFDIEADENEARITRGSAHFLGGDVAVNGRMPLTGGQLGTLEANVTGRQLFVSPSEGVKATIDADLQVTMSPQATTVSARLPFVGGDVTITSFDYTKPITLELNGFTRAARTSVVEAYDASADAVALGFDVHSRVPLRFRNNLIEAQLGIDSRGVRVSGTNQRVGLRGELTTLSGGRFRIFANDFDIQKGTIRFDDSTRVVPHIDITAVTEYRRYSNQATSGAAGAGATAAGSVSSGGRGSGIWRITLHAYGDADKLQLDMMSDPPLSREDIFFLLTIGLTRAELDQVQAGSVYASAAFEALGTVTGVDRAVKQVIPVIDDFRPGTAYSPRTGRVEPNITVGRRLTENVRARLTSGLAEDPQLRSTIEWRLNRTFTIEPSYDRINSVSSSNIGNFGVDFRWSLEFD